MTAPRSTIAFVTPRYGEDVRGGAEHGARRLAESLVAIAGWDVEVFTTCALDARTWAQHYEPGTGELNGVTVHRFVASERDPDFDQFSGPLLRHPELVSPEDESEWFRRQGPVSDELISAVAASQAAHIAFYPYLYHPTVAGMPPVMDRAILHAAAHDEPPLRLPVFQKLFGDVPALAFHTDGERRMVESSFPVAAKPQIVSGLAPDPVAGSAVDARATVGLDADRPYLLCLGRVDDGKGTRVLADFFRVWKDRHPRDDIALVFAGPVVHEPPAHPDIVVAGPVSDEVKWGLLEGADLLINPSGNESFSIVLMEAWAAGTPVLVNERCEATVEHVERSGGGLTFDGYVGFEVALEELRRDAAIGEDFAAAGKAYVDRWFQWPGIVERYTRFLATLRP